MSTFSPVGLRSSNGMRMCVGVCVYGMNLKYALPWHINISVHSILCQCHKHTHILRPFEDSKPTGLKVDIAKKNTKTNTTRTTKGLTLTIVINTEKNVASS